MNNLNPLSELWGTRPVTPSKALLAGEMAESGFESDGVSVSSDRFRPIGPDGPVCCWNLCSNYASRKAPRPAAKLYNGPKNLDSKSG